MKKFSNSGQFKKGHIPHNKGIKGEYNGWKFNEETKKKISENLKERWKCKDYRTKKIEQMKKNWEIMRNLPKEKHSNWRGGISNEKYSLNYNEEFKNYIKSRDNFRCMLCGSNNLKNLNTHHIDYNKKNTTKQNCVALCNHCHAKTNYHRNYWINFYYSLLSEKYGYNYKEIILEAKNDR